MPTANDVLLDWSISHAVYLQRYGAGVVQRIIGLLNRADADIIRLIQSQDPEIDRVRLEQMVEQIQALNATIVSRMADTLNAELQDLAAAEIASQTEALTEAMPAAVRANLAIVAPAPIQVWAAVQAQPFSGALLSETYQGFDASRQRRLREAIRQSFVQGESIDQIVRRIRGTRAAQYQDGILSLSYRDAEAIARTAIAHVAGVARDETYQANSDVIKALVWTSTIDGRTSTWCRPRDGLNYTLDHKPTGHKFPWGAGPGRIHWRAVCGGTMIETSAGFKAVECIESGDMVKTHLGRYRRVLAKRSKLNDAGVVMVIKTESGGILRATDDHPVLASGIGWVFAGALETGDQLFCNPEQLAKIGWAGSMVASEPEYGPSVTDKPSVSIQRTIELVAADIHLKGDLDAWYREIENRAASMVLSNPSIIKDQSVMHHLFALSHVLGKLGRKGLGDFLSFFIGNSGSEHTLPRSIPNTALKTGLLNLVHDTWNSCRVALGHALGVCRIGFARFLGQPISPMIFSGLRDSVSRDVVSNSLLFSAPHGDVVSSCIARQASVSQAVQSFQIPKGATSFDMTRDNDLMKFGFVHDRILSLAVQKYDGYVYDLEVADDASYVANGIVVSNCRSTSTPVLKSWRELGFDHDELPGSSRASMDGQIPEETTYAQWLRGKDFDFVADVLGVDKARLFLNGQLPLDRFYDRRGNELTLDQIRQREREAWKRAGLSEAA